MRLLEIDEAPLSRDWTASKGLKLSRQRLPFGSVLSVEAAGPSVARTARVPRDWTGFAEFSMQVQVVSPVTVEIRLPELEGNGGFWRRVDLVPGDWRPLVLPLRWFRWFEPGRVPSFSEIGALELRLRGPGSFRFRDVSVSPGCPRLDGSDLAEGMTICEGEAAVLIHELPGLDVGAAMDHLAQVRAAVAAELHDIPVASARPHVVLCRTAERYRAYVLRLAERLGAVTQAPSADGYTIHGIATGSGTAWRSSHTHEYLHALLSAAAHLPNRGEWLQEGLACRFQTRFHPQESLASIIDAGMADTRSRSPLSVLCAGGKIPLNRYWQAMTVVGWLLSGDGSKMTEVLAFAGKSGSSDLAAALRLPWEDIERAWIAHVVVASGR